MIHVLIERHIAEDMITTYEKLAKETLHRTYMVPGFISGEAFHNAENPGHRFLLCKWRSHQDWHNWISSDTRRELMSQFAPILLEPERITLLTNSV